MSREDEHIAANLLEFLYLVDLWLKEHDLSLCDFYEWEDKRNEDLYKVWGAKNF